MSRLSCATVLAGAAIIIIAAAPAHADVVISTDATGDMVCGGGICSPTASDAVLNVNDLENLLASGSVEITTTGSGVQANNINFTAPLSWSSTSALVLDAYLSITVDSAVSVTGLSGLTLTTNDGGTNGTLSFGPSGNVSFANLGCSLTVNGASYALVNTIRSLASDIAGDPSGNFAFASSYDAKQDRTYKTVPIEAAFGGTFEGLGNSIRNFKINDNVDMKVGLFADLATGGAIRDIRLLHAEVQTIAFYAGSLIGYSSGVVSGCNSSGSLIGYTNKTTSAQILGGLIGNVDQGTVNESTSTSSVSSEGGGAIGGLVGDNGGVVENSYSMGEVSAGDYAYAGGLIGTSVDNDSVDGVYATGSVTAGRFSFAGGLISDSGSQVNNSYAAGSVSVGPGGGHYDAGAGGLIGANNYPGTVSTSYSIGAARSTKGQPMCGRHLGRNCVGGSNGWNGSNSVSDIYWDTTASGNTNATGNGRDTGITGLTTKQLKSGLPAGFDPSIWGEQKGINHGLPYLLAIPPKK